MGVLFLASVSLYGSGREIDGCLSPAVKDKSLLRSAEFLDGSMKLRPTHLARIDRSHCLIFVVARTGG
jgi:hypothetical protein